MLGKNFEKDLMSMVAHGEHHLERLDTMPEGWGVIPRALALLFHRLETEFCSVSTDQRSTSCSVHCSYMQLYNEQLFDLLQDKDRQFPLRVRENRKGKRVDTFVQGLSAIRVSSLADCIELLALGTENRVIRATEYNDVSSRSHAILQLCITIEEHVRNPSSAGVSTIIRTAKLNFVDLAGSEKLGIRTEMDAQRLQELRRINTSLSSLGTVIQALGEKNRKHIPYRNSLLTRLLQDSLGGNTKTVVICTLSPSPGAIAENYSTLQFADRAKLVMAKISVNKVVDDAVLLAQAQAEICRLKRVIREQGDLGAMTKLLQRVNALESENATLRTQIADMRAQSQKQSATPTQEEPQTEEQSVDTPPSSGRTGVSTKSMPPSTLKDENTPLYAIASTRNPVGVVDAFRSESAIDVSQWSPRFSEESPRSSFSCRSSKDPGDIVQALRDQLTLEEDTVPWDQRTEKAMRAAEEGYLEQIRKEQLHLDRIIQEKAVYKAMLQKQLQQQLEEEQESSSHEHEESEKGREVKAFPSDDGPPVFYEKEHETMDVGISYQNIGLDLQESPGAEICSTTKEVKGLAGLGRACYDGLKLSSKQRRAAMRKGQRRVIEQRRLTEWRLGRSVPHHQEPFQYKGLGDIYDSSTQSSAHGEERVE